MSDLVARVVDRVGAVPASGWNALAASGNPFVRHEFLDALERTGCVGDGSGWEPRHLVLEDGGAVVGAMPFYAKYHSHGEFVFDWAWADAYERAGLAYYPKLVGAIPFTPATGHRLLVAPGPDRERRRRALIEAALTLVERAGVSSAHWLFPVAEDADGLEARGLLGRRGCQFHWHNPGYRDFEDFLDCLTSRRRKQIRRERREAAAAPVEILALSGNEATESHWHAYHGLYSSTYDRKWGYPALTPGFFVEIGRRMPDAVRLLLARHDGRYVAGAHCLVGGGVLYGRNWGCTEHHRALHFEMCYYRNIEHCIAAGLERFDAGAQGEHKINRGFMPALTRSAHWVKDGRFRDAIAAFVSEERREVEAYMEAMRAHSPFTRA